MTLELSPIGILLFVIYLIAPELFYIPIAFVCWVIDSIFSIFGKGNRKP